jgi:HAE1 family hydrophobic/amphiphilic exporter-1
VLVGRGRAVRWPRSASSGLLRQEFVPSQDMSRFGIRFQTPVGSSLETSERVLDQIEAFLRTRPEVDMYGGFVGGFGGGEVNSGFTFVTLKDPHERPPDAKTGKRLSQQELMNVARQVTSAIPGRAS